MDPFLIPDVFDTLFRKIRTTASSSDDKEATTTTSTENSSGVALRGEPCSPPYMILIQHSRSCALRYHSRIAGGGLPQQQQQTTEEIYRGAKLRTPTENAQRDLVAGSLWLKFLQQKLDNYVFVQTIKRRKNNTDQTFGAIVLDATDLSIPLTKSEDSLDESTTTSTDLLERIHQKCNEISERNGKEQQQIPVVLDSLTLLHAMNSFDDCLGFLHELQNIEKCSPLIVPVLVETLNTVQHRQLEDMAQAVLCLQDGEAIFLRHGVREHGNLIRETIDYDVVRNQIVLVKPKDDTDAGDKETETANEGVTEEQKVSRRGNKIQLRLQDDEEQAKKAEPPRPQIIVEDEDPEFDDYDSEDPDDDLEI